MNPEKLDDLKKSFEEKRRYIRIAVGLPVKYRFYTYNTEGQSSISPVYSGYTSNVSTGGFLLIGAIPQETLLEGLRQGKGYVGVSISLPGEEHTLKFLAQVCWYEKWYQKAADPSDPYRIGLEIKEIDAQDKEKLYHFIINSKVDFD